MKKRRLDDDKVRVIKIGKEAIFEFIYENVIDGHEEYLDVGAVGVTDHFDMDWNGGKFIFCAINSDEDPGRALMLPEGVDLQKLIKRLPDTTDSMYMDGRYREYTIAELAELSQDAARDDGVRLTVKRFSELTAEELHSIYKLRVDVFVVEQNCPYHEIDGADRIAYHVWLEDEDGIAAYARVLPPDVVTGEIVIGRVIAKRRRCGLGSRIVAEGVRVAKDVLGADTVYIKAQTQARGFYEKCGFSVISDEYVEDGIPHIKMVRKI